MDVEGSELPVLKTIPYDKLDITLITVEYVHGEGKDKYIEFMSSKGYELHSQIDVNKADIGLYAHDLLFLKKSYIKWRVL